MKASQTDSEGTLLETEPRSAFSGWPMIIGWSAMLIFSFHACTHMVAAGDTWVAMACGRHFVHHGVDTVEPFSANSHHAGPTEAEVQKWPGWARWITDTVGLETVKKWHPTGWINQNWLTHVIFYRLATGFGSDDDPAFNALVVWKFAIYIVATVCIYYTSRVLGVNPALAVIFSCFALFLGRSFIDVRPAGFSNVLVALLLLILTLTSYRNALYIWLMVPVVVFWANVHGGYLYAFIVLVPFVGWHLIMGLPKRWMIAAYSILLWLVLYGLANRFGQHEYLTPVEVKGDWMVYVLLLAIAGSLVLAWDRRVGNGAVVGLHATISCGLFLLLLVRFYPELPDALNQRGQDLFAEYAASGRSAYFGIFSLAMILGAVVVAAKERVVRVVDRRTLLHVIGAGAVAFVAMVLFNPFHLTNLTHTFVISFSEHAERWRDVHEWHRAFDWSNPVGTAVPFLVLYIVAWLGLIGWAVLLFRTRKLANLPAKKQAKSASPFVWPQIDLALLIIAALTVYMAIRSRRFIPIAGYAACPILALLVDHVIRIGAALYQRRRTKRLEVPALPAAVETRLVLAGAAITLCFGMLWGAKFKRVYLDYWPADPKLTSIFMRMTASDAKPFYAGDFIRYNNLSGKMFNYWTEGGFIAWGQCPDAETGKTPLQLFMDGRAQAAYDRRVFDLWTQIMAGGRAARRAAMERRRPNAQDYAEIGKWVTQQLDKYNVWVVLMPNNQFDKAFVNGLVYSQDWRVVFMNNKQKMFVNINTEPGKQLFEGMFTGATEYPDEFSAHLSIGHNLLLFRDAESKAEGLQRVMKAFELDPSPAPLLVLLLVASLFKELRPQIDEFCAGYAAEFETNKAKYAGHHGYNLRLEAARLALLRMEQLARIKGNNAAAQTCVEQMNEYIAERNRISNRKRW
ncbi:MAG: hypothetical protein JSW27_19070 [Phycisphaerales bacterium]|nr:MAG: hypothetical protein JSW27_19070 [Phycisphaerales bacterium]